MLKRVQNDIDKIVIPNSFRDPLSAFDEEMLIRRGGLHDKPKSF
jgi:hypothetical protein